MSNIPQMQWMQSLNPSLNQLIDGYLVVKYNQSFHTLSHTAFLQRSFAQIQRKFGRGDKDIKEGKGSSQLKLNNRKCKTTTLTIFEDLPSFSFVLK